MTTTQDPPETTTPGTTTTAPTATISTFDQLAAQRPENLDQAITCMHEALIYFHGERDKRAVFLRLYYLMTLEVHKAVHGLGDYKGKRIFLDPEWIVRLSGIFSSLYFESLTTSDREADVERAWKIAHQMAESGRGTITQDALLGIIAHIMYDLPRAIAKNLAEHGDLADESVLRRRKFDHDQVNNLLVRSIDPIQKVLSEDYDPSIEFLDHLLGGLDERLSEIGLKRYRERVWWDALSYAAAAELDQNAADVVRDKLNWESYKAAQRLTGDRFLQRAAWYPEKVLGPLARLGGYRRFGRSDLEMPGE
ncbi:MAG TPA: DUF5995 family protein [Pseudonocardia sp.]|jgi:hypothetical protein|nr:DUF5995 family protein [Pseudonocardia sp.]